MANATMQKFDYPASTVYETDHWAVLLRPKQATLGALILVSTSEVTAFGDLPPAAFADLQSVVAALGTALSSVLAYDNINYLMLMMVDPHVHFHVLPRYDAPRSFEGISFTDPAWPGAPDLGFANDCDDDTRARLLKALRLAWRR